MSESMIERVATAIRRADAERGTYYGVDEVDALTLARAAIEAMREPTGKMEHAGYEALLPDNWPHDEWPVDGKGDEWASEIIEARMAYRAMIDAALNEQVSA